MLGAHSYPAYNPDGDKLSEAAGHACEEVHRDSDEVAHTKQNTPGKPTAKEADEHLRMVG